jgi:presenilin 1
MGGNGHTSLSDGGEGRSLVASMDDVEQELDRQAQGEAEVARRASERRASEFKTKLEVLKDRDEDEASSGATEASHVAARVVDVGARPAGAEEEQEEFRELMFSFNSFLAVFWPVSLTMWLTVLAVVFINDGLNGNGAGGALLLPTPIDEAATTTTGEKVEAAVLNMLAIIGVIIGMTFMLVLLYYFNCFKIIYGYLGLSIILLLGFTTGYMLTVALFVYQIPMDQITYWLFFYNYAIVGALAIFYQKGLPRVLTQCYLVCVSVVMAWVLLRVLPEWTSWAVLVGLGFYDLCAVLTPCGPLSLLIGIAGDKENSMPGLLYEAQINEQAPGGAAEAGAASAASGRGGAGAAGPLGMFIFMADRAPSGDAPVPAPAPAPAPATPAPAPAPAPGGPKDDEAFADRNSIKLGLGDFVFYSVLVGRAALNGLTTTIAVYVTVVFGLASTLILLAIYQKALPALPISIFFGVTFYFATGELIVPMANELALVYITI